MLDWYSERFRRAVDYLFYTLEAHCSPALTLKHLRQAGFKTEDPTIDRLVTESVIGSNPHYLSQGSSLHSSIVAVK